MSGTDMLLLVCLTLALVLYALAAVTLRIQICGFVHHPKAYFQYAFTVLPILAMCVVPVPLPVFYLIYHITSGIPNLTGAIERHQAWLMTNVRFLFFTVPHLTILGMLALCAQIDIQGVLSIPALRILSLTAAITLNILTNIALRRFFDSGHLKFITWDSGELRLFSRFLWFCVCSAVFDSIPCLFPLPTKFPLFFLIGCNLLLLMMAALFGRHVYCIMRDSYLKDEYLRLQEETAVQRLRTVELEREAYLDVLTGIYSRQYVLTNMANMLDGNETFLLAFLDLDQLKQVNDRLGHLAGDAHLQKFSVCMKAALRPNDVFARFGGDEFLILFPDCPIASAQRRLEEIQSDASEHPPDGWGIPFSFGLVEVLPDRAFSADEWIAVADHAMYKNKKSRKLHREGSQ